MLSFGSVRNSPRTNMHKYISSQYNPSVFPSKLREATSQLTKSQCCYHPQCRITNFCACYQCLLPLCPKCIKSHTEEHAQVGIHGEFDTIQECLEKADTTLVDFIKKAEGISHRANNIHEAGRARVQQIRNEFLGYREKAICQFVGVFDRYEEHLEGMIREEQAKLTKDINKVADAVNYLVQTSKKCLQSLYSPNSLDNLISFYSTTYLRSQDTIKMCNSTLSQALSSKIIITHFPQKLTSLTLSLKQYLAMGVFLQPGAELPKVLRDEVYSPMAKRIIQNKDGTAQDPRLAATTQSGLFKFS